MNLPDFTVPLQIELRMALEIAQKAREEIPYVPEGDKRRDLALALLHVGAEHVMSILHLFKIGAYSSGNALMRPAFESLYKSVWIAAVATEEQVEQAWNGRNVYGTFKKIIADITSAPPDSELGALFGKIDSYRSTLNGLTHSGSEQFLRRLQSRDMRAPQYEFEILLRDVRTLPGLPGLICTSCNHRNWIQGAGYGKEAAHC